MHYHAQPEDGMAADGGPLCWVAKVRDELRTAKLRPTRQRLLIASLLFRTGDRHVTAEQLHHEATVLGAAVSLATVYNTLRQFSDAGMIRTIAVQATKSYFDTNTSDHHHFFVEGEGTLVDIPDGVVVTNVPAAPSGMRVTNVDVMVHLRAERAPGKPASITEAGRPHS
jgi:Fur family iron response transcriptional regulator